ncbi:MAG: NBR1-Ig-like domain-containing protein [Bacteroidota bacterium]
MKVSKALLSVGLLMAVGLSACRSKAPEPTPTQSVQQIQTFAVGTFAAGLTATALAQPTATLTPSPIATNTLNPTIAISTFPAVSPTGAVAATCNGLIYMADVTVPDNTVMTPGQAFTKTWRVQNSGTCAWAAGYKFSLIGGDAMGAQALTLSQPVEAGATYEISVPMTAPASGTGTISGTWRMADASGVFFGDALTVIISLGGTTGTGTAGPTATQGAGATATNTPRP